MKNIMLCFVLSLLALVAGCGGRHRTFGKLAYVTGTARVFDAAKGTWADADNGADVRSGDSIRTSKESEAVVTIGNSTIKLSENTCIAVSDTLDSQGKRLVAVLNTGGEVLSDVKDLERHGTRYEVWTPTAVAHAEGTHFTVVFSPQPYVTNVRVLDGRVRVFNPFLPSAPQVFVAPGCYTTVAYNAAPVAAAPMNYGQFKKMQRLLGPRYYHDYEKRFRIDPEIMVLDAPIVVVPIVSAPVFIPVVREHHGPHGRLEVSAPFLLPPGPGMPLPVPPIAPIPGMPVPGMVPMPHAPHAGLMAPIPPGVPPMMPPKAPRGGMIPPVSPLPPGMPVPPVPGPGMRGMVAPGPIGPVPVPHGRIVNAGRGNGDNGQGGDDDGKKGKHKDRRR
jgi:hypothetical protein